ncbi:MAG: N-glycosylase/DNA lyase [Candidatus Helarchaeota archaeon]
MEILLNSLEKSKKSQISTLVQERLTEFKKIGESNNHVIFKELCFCILTANCAAEKCINVQKEIDNGFLLLTENELAARLKEVGYRFPNVRANYIVNARRFKDDIKDLIESSDSSDKLRSYLSKNIKGLGYKEASHFLRNIGFDDLAIIDFHIIDILQKHGLIERPKTLTKKKYREIENVLKEIGMKINMNMAELDLHLWSMETGKVLK